MFSSINAFQLLKYQKFPTYQQCQQDNTLTEFNPYKVNFYLSHPPVAPDSTVSSPAVSSPAAPLESSTKKFIGENLRQSSPNPGDQQQQQQPRQFYFDQFVIVLFRMINRCLHQKFLDDDRNDLYQFDKEFIYDRATGFDLYRQILDPTEEEIKILGNYLNLDLLTKDVMIMIFAYLNDISIWIDWTCMPDVEALTSAQIEQIFEENQQKRDWIIENSYVICLWESTEQFYDAWCVLESLLSLRVAHCYFHNIDNSYELTAHQFNTETVRLSASTISSPPTPKLTKRRTFIPSIRIEPSNPPPKEKDTQFFTDYSKLPKFYIALLKYMKCTADIQEIFNLERISVSFSSSPKEEVSLIIKLLTTNYEKYSYQFFTYAPHFSTRVPKDYRSKLINHLQNIYTGGKRFFNPILHEYVTLPITTMNQKKYQNFVKNHLREITPFYSDATVAYYPGELQTLDPYILLHATFDLHELKGTMINIDLQMVEILNSADHQSAGALITSPPSVTKPSSTIEEQKQEQRGNDDEEDTPLVLSNHITMEELKAKIQSFDMTTDLYRTYPKIQFIFPCTLSLCNDHFFQYLVSYKFIKDYSKPQMCLYESKFFKRARQKHFYTQWNLHFHWWKERKFRLTEEDLVYVDDHEADKVKGDINIDPKTVVREIPLNEQHSLYRELKELHQKTPHAASDTFPGHLLEIYNTSNPNEVLLALYFLKKEPADLFQFYFQHRAFLSEAQWIHLPMNLLEQEFFCQDRFRLSHLFKHFSGAYFTEKFQQVSQTIVEKTGGNIHNLFDQTGK